MSDDRQDSWEPGKGTSVEAAAAHAWENARANGAGPGTYKLDVFIEASNPIHSYIVVITPTG